MALIDEGTGREHITDEDEECWCNPQVIAVSATKVIPAEAIEAARDILPLELRIYVGRVEMRAMLEAAAPHMAAQVWDDALEAGEHWCRDLNPSEIPNPYRPTK